MASFDASEAQAEQVGHVASLENNMGGVMAELQRLRSEVAQNARNAQNANSNQMLVHNMFFHPPLFPILISPNPHVFRASHLNFLLSN